MSKDIHDQRKTLVQSEVPRPSTQSRCVSPVFLFVVPLARSLPIILEQKRKIAYHAPRGYKTDKKDGANTIGSAPSLRYI